MPYRATQDRWVTVKSADKTWSTGGGNGNTLQHSGSENPMKGIKRQKDMTPEDEPLWLEGVQCVTGEKQRAITNSSTKNEAQGQVETTLSCVSGGEGEV